METIKVNMSPNPLDVQTIHASQNDGEARQWEFELHNNGELIDTSDVKEQLVFKAYKGGTEQLLPENGSTPTTSPFKGDIRYPQGLLTDQEFTYRQSPTESDGLAKITDIKGNTLVWNQLVGRTDSYTTSKNGITITITGASDRSISLTAQGTVSLTVEDPNYYGLILPINVKNGHKYLLSSTSSNFCLFGYGAGTTQVNQQKSIFTSATDGTMGFTIRPITSAFTDGKVINETFYVMLIDLTQMFGSGNEPTSVSDFTSLFPLSYYSYNQGSLLSFNGNGLKTVGKNLLNPSFTIIDAYINGSGVITASSNDKSVIVPLLPNLSYVFTWNRGRIISSVADDTQVGLYNEYPSIGVRGVLAGNTSVSGGNIRFNSASNRYAVIKISNITRTDFDSTIIGSQLEFGTTPSSYEPYTSSTLSLPISTYFPTGMKSAGNVYDEITESKAVTRVGSITVNGSENWIKSSSYEGNYYCALLRDAIPNAENIINSYTSNVIATAGQLNNYDQCLMIDGSVNSQNINIKNADISTLAEFKAWLHANPVTIYYELKTPTETSFTTASLVTENAEIPLSNEDGVLLGKCTKQLSENPGFIDAKIKLSDADGECYSNKIQLHVEREPS